MMFNDHVLLKRELTAIEPKYDDPQDFHAIKMSTGSKHYS